MFALACYTFCQVFLSRYILNMQSRQVMLRPSIVSLTVERVICDGLRTLAGSTLGMAMATVRALRGG